MTGTDTFVLTGSIDTTDNITIKSTLNGNGTNTWSIKSVYTKLAAGNNIGFNENTSTGVTTISCSLPVYSGDSVTLTTYDDVQGVRHFKILDVYPRLSGGGLIDIKRQQLPGNDYYTSIISCTIPEPPAAGSFHLVSINGKLQWVAI